MPEYYYRLDNGNGDIYVTKYRVSKTTPKGVWLELGTGAKRFQLKNSRKRFACSTIEEAQESFVARKNKQKKILTARLTAVEQALTQLPQAMARWQDDKDTEDFLVKLL